MRIVHLCDATVLLERIHLKIEIFHLSLSLLLPLSLSFSPRRTVPHPENCISSTFNQKANLLDRTLLRPTLELDHHHERLNTTTIRQTDTHEPEASKGIYLSTLQLTDFLDLSSPLLCITITRATTRPPRQPETTKTARTTREQLIARAL